MHTGYIIRAFVTVDFSNALPGGHFHGRGRRRAFRHHGEICASSKARAVPMTTAEPETRRENIKPHRMVHHLVGHAYTIQN